MKKIASFILASAVVACGLSNAVSATNDTKEIEVLEVEAKQEVQDILDFELVDDPATHTHLV